MSTRISIVSWNDLGLNDEWRREVASAAVYVGISLHEVREIFRFGGRSYGERLVRTAMDLGFDFEKDFVYVSDSQQTGSTPHDGAV